MPFTFAHPVAIIPFLNNRKKFFSATGLIIGSLAPDFESFILLNDKKIYGHTWLGVLWFDLPLAILLALFFHGIVREPLIRNLPRSLYNRLKRFEHIKWFSHFKRHFFVVILSMLIGIVSHLLLDAFTHLNLYEPDAQDSPIYFGTIQLYILLQYTVSLIGLILIMFYLFRIPAVPLPKTVHREMQFKIAASKRPTTSKWSYWILLTIFACLVMITCIYFLEREMNIILFIDIIIAGICSALIIVPLVQKLVTPSQY